MTCEICNKPLRKDNKVGACRPHRSLSTLRKQYMSSYATANSEELAAYKKNWAQVNKDSINSRSKQRRTTEPNFKLAHALRTRINRAIKSNFKVSSVIENLGCSISELREHLEKQFSPGMTWANHTQFGWHIDHIIPLHTVDLTNETQFKRVSHFSNLRPLWWKENIQRNRIKSQE